jgi:alcohol dehydrogenase
MEFNLDVSLEKYAEIGRIAGIEAGNKEESVQGLIQKIKDLSQALSIPSLAELGITEDDFPAIAQKSFENNSNPSNPKDATSEDYLQILKRASR